jgi:hypothetical protein
VQSEARTRYVDRLQSDVKEEKVDREGGSIG